MFGFEGDEAAKTDLDPDVGDSGEAACKGVGDRDSGSSEGDASREWDTESFGIKGGAESDESAGVADSGETRDSTDSDEAADAGESDEAADARESDE